MSDIWYYVQSGERKGPVEVSVIKDLLASSEIGTEDYVWKKGLEDWTKVKDLNEFDSVAQEEVPSALPPIAKKTSNNLYEIVGDDSAIFVKIGVDRGVKETEYGPYDIDLMKKLFKEKRINGKTFIFVKGMENWQMLADFDDFSEIFEDVPPPIKDEERRASIRKPFIARMYIQNKDDVYVGICRDISIGGMQVLVDRFPGDVGDRISINVHPENTDHHFVAAGSIVRLLDNGQGFSFRFSEISQNSIEAIEKYLAND